MRKSGLAVLTVALAVAGCGYQHRPIYNVDDPLPRWDQNLPLQRVEDLIVSGCTSLSWKTQHVAEGHLVAIQAHEKFSATVDIFFDHDHWRIQYASSDGLNAKDGTIHSHYNVWVRNLEREIQLRFNSTLPPTG